MNMRSVKIPLILGATQLKYASQCSFSNRFVIHYHTGDKVDDICDEVFEHIALHSAVVLQYGANNVPVERPDATAAKFERLIHKLRKLNPGVVLMVSGVLPRGRNEFLDLKHQQMSEEKVDFFNSRALVLNGLLHALCLKFKAVHFLDHWDAYMIDGEVNRALISKDGFHLTSAGIRMLLKEILKVSKNLKFESFPKSLPSRPISCSRSTVSCNINRESKPVVLKRDSPKRITVFKEKKEDPKIEKTWFQYDSRHFETSPSCYSTRFFWNSSYIQENTSEIPLKKSDSSNSNSSTINNRPEKKIPFQGGGFNDFLRCKFCRVSILTKNMNLHLSKCVKIVSCSSCNRKFSTSFHLEQHKCSLQLTVKLQNEGSAAVSSHDVNSSISTVLNKVRRKNVLPKRRCLEPNCNLQFFHVSSLYKHLKNHHNLNLEVEELFFNTLEDFFTWKENEDSHHFLKNLSVGSKKEFLYFVCNFHGIKKRFLKYRTARRKTAGTQPCLQCPSRILAKLSEYGVQVTYFKSHNHRPDFRNVLFHQLPKKVLQNIKNKLTVGIGVNHIQEELQGNVTKRVPTDDLVKKENFITRRQIRQIHQRLKESLRRDPDDAKSVYLFVKELETEPFNPVFIYKPIDGPSVIGPSILDGDKSLFVLGIQSERQFEMMKAGALKILCIDATHKTNYYDFYLINLIVPDEYGQGYPVGHIITNKINSCVMERTMEIIKNRYETRGIVLQINSLMTDDDKITGPAIQKVFGSQVKHLLCKWHVHRSFKTQIQNKIKNKEMQSLVYHELFRILEEREENRFWASINSFYINFKPYCKNFMNYFERYYMNRCHLWAMAFRNFPHAHTDTNMFCESFHNKLKTYYMERKQNRRVDKLMEILLKCEGEYSALYYFKKNTKKESLLEKNALIRRHKRAFEIKEDNLIQLDESLWQVISATSNLNTNYLVIRVAEKCPVPNFCMEQCPKNSCKGLCSHLFTCDCPDRNPLCKHIHKIFMITTGACMKQFLKSNDSLKFYSSSSVPYHEIGEKEIERVSNDLELIQSMLQDSKIKKIIFPQVQRIVTHLKNFMCGVASISPESKNTHRNDGKLLSQKLSSNTSLKLQFKKFQKPRNIRPPVHKFKITSKTLALSKSINRLKNSVLDHNYYQKPSIMKQLNSFSPPLSYVSDPSKPLLRFNEDIDLSLNQLKSLDLELDDLELKSIKLTSPNFHPKWLYESIIDAYFFNITKNSATTSFFPCFYSQAVQRNANPTENIFNISPNHSHSKQILIPFNLKGNHWVLLIFYPERNQFYLLDPLEESNIQVCRPLIDSWGSFLQQYFHLQTHWTVFEPKRVLQSDGYNCGVFVCYYGLIALNGKLFTENFDPTSFRSVIYTTIVFNCLSGEEHDVDTCLECLNPVFLNSIECSVCARKFHRECLPCPISPDFRCL